MALNKKMDALSVGFAGNKNKGKINYCKGKKYSRGNS